MSPATVSRVLRRWGQGAEARKRDLSNKIQHSLKWKFAMAAAIERRLWIEFVD